MNFYKHHIGDYDAHTGHLSWSEDLVYRRLLSAYYLRERPLPADIKILRRLVKAVEAHQVRAMTTVMDEFFVLRDGHYHNERADIEIEQYQAQCEANRHTTRQRIVKRLVNESSTNRQPNQNQNPDITPRAEVPTRVDPEHAFNDEEQTRDEIQDQQTSTQRKINGTPIWWKTNEGIEKMGREMGIMARSGEDYPTFKNRLFEEIAKRKRPPPPNIS